jgi:hypothetical protein
MTPYPFFLTDPRFFRIMIPASLPPSPLDLQNRWAGNTPPLQGTALVRGGFPIEIPLSRTGRLRCIVCGGTQKPDFNYRSHNQRPDRGDLPIHSGSTGRLAGYEIHECEHSHFRDAFIRTPTS